MMFEKAAANLKHFVILKKFLRSFTRLPQRKGVRRLLEKGIFRMANAFRSAVLQEY